MRACWRKWHRVSPTLDRKIPKISPGACIFQMPFLRGLFLEGVIFGRAYLRFKIDWASLIVGSKFTVLLCIWGQFSKYNPRGPYIWRGDLTEGFFALPVWGAYIWRGLYRGGGGGLFLEFYGVLLLYIEWILTNYCKLSRNYAGAIRTTTINCRASFIDLYLVFPRNFRIVFLPHTTTVIFTGTVLWYYRRTWVTCDKTLSCIWVAILLLSSWAGRRKWGSAWIAWSL